MGPMSEHSVLGGGGCSRDIAAWSNSVRADVQTDVECHKRRRGRGGSRTCF